MATSLRRCPLVLGSIILGACGFLTLKQGVSADQDVSAEVRAATFGGDPLPLPKEVPGSYCRKNGITCQDESCLVDLYSICWGCQGVPYDMCVPALVEGKNCKHVMGANGTEWYCGKQWWGYLPIGANQCNPWDCEFLDCSRCCGAEIPTGFVSPPAIDVCNNGE